MSKTMLAGFAAAAALITGAALATERSPVGPSAPQAVAELGRGGSATVGGTVVSVGNEHFTLADAEGQKLRVDAEHLRLGDLAPGQMLTVIGRLDDGELKAQQIIRDDGSVLGRGGDARRDRDGDDD
jgi:uncharacterized protein (DUF1786 family)